MKETEDMRARVFGYAESGREQHERPHKQGDKGPLWKRLGQARSMKGGVDLGEQREIEHVHT